MRSTTNTESALQGDVIQLLSIWTIKQGVNSANMVHTLSNKVRMLTEPVPIKSAKSINTMIYLEIVKEIIVLISSITITMANVSFVSMGKNLSPKALSSN